ncbi:unnamed protein product [Lampetra planeri]
MASLLAVVWWGSLISGPEQSPDQIWFSPESRCEHSFRPGFDSCAGTRAVSRSRRWIEASRSRRLCCSRVTVWGHSAGSLREVTV